GVLDGSLEGGPGDSDGHRGDTGTGAVEGHHRQLEAAVFLADQVLGGNLDVVEGQGHGVRSPLPHLVFLLVDDDAVLPVYDESRDSLGTGFRVGLGVDRVPVGVFTVGDEALGAV